MDLSRYIRNSLLDKYEFQNYGHALEILNEAFPSEWQDIQNCLENLTISLDDIRAAGGNETAIPKKFDDVLDTFKKIQDITHCSTGCGGCHQKVLDLISEIMSGETA